jgi:ribonuclease T1
VFFLGQSYSGRGFGKLGLAVVMAGATLFAQAKETPQVGPEDVALSQLPAEARDTERLIRAGGPFPYPKDGTTFGNRERLLPSEPRGYYREYTVKTPGLKGRGARRMVCGGRQPTVPDACFYTSDHYTSFRRVVQ